MTVKMREVVLAATLGLLIGACGQRSVDPIELLDTTSPGQFEVISVEPIPPEEVGDNRYFYGTLETSEIDNGGFERTVWRRWPSGRMVGASRFATEM